MLSESPVTVLGDVLSQQLDEETVLLNVDTGDYFGLTPVASRTWELLQQHRSPQQIATQLEDEFDTNPETVESDLAEFLEELRARHLIKF